MRSLFMANLEKENRKERKCVAAFKSEPIENSKEKKRKVVMRCTCARYSMWPREAEAGHAHVTLCCQRVRFKSTTSKYQAWE